VPWTRVARLSSSSAFDEVRNQVAAKPHSRWPVIDAESGRPVGHISVKELIAEGAADGNWLRLVRPIQTLEADDDVQTALVRLQEARMNMCVVEEAGTPVGLITLEDLVEQAVGRVKEQYPQEPGALLAEALRAGNAVVELSGRTADHVIRELAEAIPRRSGIDPEDVARLALAREDDISTDLGVGVAIPHARIANLPFPFIVFGRSADGVIFSPRSQELVKSVFLLVTPLERPDVQLFLLGQLARVALNPQARQQLAKAMSVAEVVEIIHRQQA
jgi:mannitol/fructose-specific phosphotransferase system IIA component (Ntr-type)